MEFLIRPSGWRRRIIALLAGAGLAALALLLMIDSRSPLPMLPQARLVHADYQMFFSNEPLVSKARTWRQYVVAGEDLSIPKIVEAVTADPCWKVQQELRYRASFISVCEGTGDHYISVGMNDIDAEESSEAASYNIYAFSDRGLSLGERMRNTLARMLRN